MKKTALLFTACFLLVQFSFATIRRVGFFGPPIPGTDYATLQLAHDAAVSGSDSILIFPGAWTATNSKKLVYLSNGYFLSGPGANNGLQAITGNTTVEINLDNGSNGSSFNGIGGLSLNTIQGASDSNIIVHRCRLTLYVYTDTHKDWQITQSYVNGWTFAAGGHAILSNFFVSNCYLTNIDFTFSESEVCTGNFANNIFDGNNVNFNTSAFYCYNNIFLTDVFIGQNACIFFNNLASSNVIPAIIPATNDNTAVTLSTLFVGYPTQGAYSNDGRYALSPGSPAIGAGIGGDDCGIFGGSAPYRLSGIPPIPSFYLLTAPSPLATTNPYNITFSVKSNN